jgi:hypothetical protein
MWYAPFPDGWWPKLRVPHVLCGNRTWRVLHVDSKETIASGPGWQHGWIDASHICVSEALGGHDEIRQVFKVNIYTSMATLLYQGPVGNVIGVVGGFPLWCTATGIYWVERPGSPTQLVKGRFLPQSLRVNGERGIVTEQIDEGNSFRSYRPVCIDRLGTVLRDQPFPTEHAHTIIPVPLTELMTYGYFGPCFLAGITGHATKINVMPNEREGPPTAFFYEGQLWGARPAERRTKGADVPGVLVGPLESKTQIQRWGWNTT